MQLADDISSEDLKVFLEEAEEQLQLLDEEVIRLEKEATDEGLQTIFRAAHTLKGSSGMIGYRAMAEVAHAMESLLDKLRNGAIQVTAEVIDALLHSLDALRILTEELANPQGVSVDFEALVKELDASAAAQTGEEESSGSEVAASSELELSDDDLKQAEAASEKGLNAYKVSCELDGEPAFMAIRSFQLYTELAEVGEVVASAPTLTEIEEEKAGTSFQALLLSDKQVEDVEAAAERLEQLKSVEVSQFNPGRESSAPAAESGEAAAETEAAPAETPEAAAPVGGGGGGGDDRKPQVAQTVRIDVDRLDHLMNLIGELVIDRTRIQQISKSLSLKFESDDLVEALGKTTTHVVKVVNDLQEDFMKVRMMPISTVFNSFPRMMRDLSRKLEKPIEFLMDGGETEIDRTVIERIRDPLVHMLRNALDHGMETPDERNAAGKEPTGTIHLEAFHEQGHIVIRVTDDGRGIEPEQIKDAFVKKGLITREVADRLSDSEAVDLIFMPGASIKEQATEVSGRGVGMDIVKSNVEAINGFIDVETKPGKGSVFTMRLPLTLATVESILVTVHDTLCAIPLVYVLEAVKLADQEIDTVQGREVFKLRDKVIPLVELTEATGMKVEVDKEEDSRRIVIVKSGERLAGLAVTALLEPQEIVVKSLGKYVGDTKGVTGASILGDGRVVLILDVPSMINAAGVRSRKSQVEEPKVLDIRPAEVEPESGDELPAAA